MKRSFATAIALLCACPVLKASPVTFSVEPDHTLPKFSYTHFGFSRQEVRFDRATGKIVLDMQAKTGSVNISIDMASVNSGIELFNKHLKSGDFFNVDKYPTATFKSNAITFEDDRPVSISGELTLHGVTQSVIFTVTSFKHGPHEYHQNREAIGGNATATVSREQFGLGRFEPSVSDAVTISFGLEALRD
ncbi:MAG TPA: YceI family protein [Steroidobacteraceae bacterium]